MVAEGSIRVLLGFSVKPEPGASAPTTMQFSLEEAHLSEFHVVVQWFELVPVAGLHTLTELK